MLSFRYGMSFRQSPVSSRHFSATSLTPAINLNGPKSRKQPASTQPVHRSKSFPLGNPRAVKRPSYKPSLSNLRVTLKYDNRHPVSDIDRLTERRPGLPISQSRLQQLLTQSSNPQSINQPVDVKQLLPLNNHTLRASIASHVPYMKGCVDYRKYEKFFVTLNQTNRLIDQLPNVSSKINDNYHQSIIQCHQILHQRLVDQQSIDPSTNQSTSPFVYSKHRSAYSRLTTLAIRSMMTLKSASDELTQSIYQILVDYQSINQSFSSNGSIVPYCEYVRHLCLTNQFDRAYELVDVTPHPALIISLIDALAHRNEMNRIVSTVKRYAKSINQSIIHCALKSLTYSSKPSKSTGICPATRGMHSAAKTLSDWASEIWVEMETAHVRPTAHTYTLLSHPAYHSSASTISTLVHAATNDQRIRLTDKLIMHLSLRCAEFGEWNVIMKMLSCVQYERKRKQPDHFPTYRGTPWQHFMPNSINDQSSIDHTLSALASQLRFSSKSINQSERGRAGSETFNALARALSSPSYHFSTLSGPLEIPPFAIFSRLSRLHLTETQDWHYGCLLSVISRCGDWQENELMWQLYKQARAVQLCHYQRSQNRLFIALCYATSRMKTPKQLHSVAHVMRIHEYQALHSKQHNQSNKSHEINQSINQPLTQRAYHHLVRAYLHQRDYKGLFDILTQFRQQSHFGDRKIRKSIYELIVFSLCDHPDMIQELVKFMFQVRQKTFTTKQIERLDEQWKTKLKEINQLHGTQGIDRAIEALSG